MEYRNRIIFTDEISLTRLDWMEKKNEKFYSKNLLRIVKHGSNCVIIWCCMNTHGVGTLQYIDEIINYDEIIRFIN